MSDDCERMANLIELWFLRKASGDLYAYGMGRTRPQHLLEAYVESLDAATQVKVAVNNFLLKQCTSGNMSNEQIKNEIEKRHNDINANVERIFPDIYRVVKSVREKTPGTLNTEEIINRLKKRMEEEE